MNINNLKSSIDYSVVNNSNKYTKDLRHSDKIQNSQNLQKDTLDISHSRRPNMGIMLDKGTAANTTVYVNYSTFRQIVSYTANNEECPWSELGIDGEKRWVVVNGQRFECPLSEEEKEAFKRASLTLMDVLEEYEKAKEKLPSQRKENKKVEIDFDKDKFSVSDESNSKVSNLLKNKKVMNMLRDISRFSGNKIHLSL
ncbi:hypothetical protein NPD7_257 [Clostridium sporogenes]|uniref:hypothetical protein n=1 Tax=Clostridium TaxID=1485 RepID=UPI00090A4F0B|nr:MULTISPECIES: hypothetical protein [Clostridium]APF28121.1 hypothetical protein NPD7_257 [Clostridium sporogenes]MDI6918355.1 hypothetical protein [Clostridium botulinum]WMU96880.1 hypothetical protein QA656_14005 [Clostridium botulinum]